MAATTHFTPQEICENVIHHVKISKLNFILSETPYSVNISLRKRFLKEVSPQTYFPKPENTSPKTKTIDREIELTEENGRLKMTVEKLVAEKASDREVIDMLEEKIEKAES